MINPKVQDNNRKLRLSHMFYRDSEIDINMARQLTVLYYGLSKGYKWKQWEKQLDEQLSDLTETNGRPLYPYLMRSYRGGFGLFVALESRNQQEPVIYNEDGVRLTGELVEYSPEHNPIWLRLIMRKSLAFQAHSRGSNTLGRPLLKIDEWNNANGHGVNAIAVDCRMQQLRDKETTEVVLFYENIPLREVFSDSPQYDNSGPLWVYDDSGKMLVRWIPRKGVQHDGVVLRQIRKNANKRKTRPFINMNSAQEFMRSWPYILKPIQDALIKQAAEYGFYLQPKVLNLQKLKVNTNYKNISRTKSFTNLNLDHPVDVLDLRFDQSLPAERIINVLTDVLQENGINAPLHLLPPIDPPDISRKIDQLQFADDQRVLVLLDQRPGVLDDHYEYTIKLRTRVACQHMNVNPHDLGAIDAVDDALLIETDEGLLLSEGSAYYRYTEAQYEGKEIRKQLGMITGIVLKELHLKHLLLNKQVKISTALPGESEVLTDRLAVVTNGYIFTVRDDRPVMVAFDPSAPASRFVCNKLLDPFSVSVEQLLALLKEKWPYNYRPEAVMAGFGSQAEKMTSFAQRLTMVLHLPEGSDQPTSIMIQDPGYETPNMLPDKLEETLQLLKQQKVKYSLHKWVLPEIDRVKETALTLEKKHQAKLDPCLSELVDCWKQAIESMQRDGMYEVAYYRIKKVMRDIYGEKIGKLTDKRVISAWDNLVSRIFDRPLTDLRSWVREIPGIRSLWYDPDKHYYIVGSLTSPKKTLERQPSIRQWHALQGEININLLTGLIDVDWVRMNQLAGNPCVASLVKKWKECQSEPGQSLNEDLLASDSK
ncbi:hypothetical protein [Spirochaeta dissipatitropha]